MFDLKWGKYAKKQENTALSKGKKKLTESIPGEAHTLGVLDQGFSCAPVAKDDNKGRNKGNQNDEQAENTSEEVEITKSDQIETEKWQ